MCLRVGLRGDAISTSATRLICSLEIKNFKSQKNVFISENVSMDEHKFSAYGTGTNLMNCSVRQKGDRGAASPAAGPPP